MLLGALYSAEQVRELDRCAIEDYGIPGIVLMKRAGKAAFDVLLKHWPQVDTVQVICGGGNNGGDGYVLAALARQRGLSVVVWQLTDSLNGDAKRAYDYAVQQGVPIHPFEAESFQLAVQSAEKTSVLVDALLGTGISGELRDPYPAVIHAINQSALPVLSIDCPSGVNGNNGVLESVAVKANVTVSFIGQKLGNLVGQGRTHSGCRYLNDLDVPEEVYSASGQVPVASRLELGMSLEKLPQRHTDSHKGDYGHLLVVGGDEGYGGAPLMAAEMAVSTGAGLVGVVTRPSNVSAIIARRPELMAAGVTSGQQCLPFLEKPSVLVVGPGLGQSAWSEQLLYQCLHAGKPLVLDADALNLLATGRFQCASNLESISTPHPGEAARLLGLSVADVQADRISAINALQEQLGGAVILKGAGSLVMTSKRQLYVCDAGNPHMAAGGMGDVLSGLLGSLLAQGLSIDDAACLGTLLHSVAADLAVAERHMKGLLATELIEYVRLLLSGEYRADGWVGHE